MPLSDHAKQILGQSGWYQGRQADITEVVSFLSIRGYHMNPPLAAYFKEFHGLRVSFVDDRGRADLLIIDVPGYKEMEPDEFGEEAGVVGSELCYIGEYSSAYALMLMPPSGEVYVRFEDHFCLAGSDAYDALDTILCSKPMKFIPSP